MRYFFPLFFIIAALLGFFMYTNPQYQLLKTRIDEYQQITTANSKAATLRAVRQKLIEDKNKIAEADVDKLKKMIPDSVENVGLIIDIDNIAVARGMRIKNTRVADSSPQSGSVVGPDSKKHGSIALSFSVTTSYENFIAFLKDLEDNARLVDVTNLTFSAGKDDKYDFNITLQTYWLK